MEESKLLGIKGRGNSGGDHDVLVQEEEEDVVFPGFRFHPTDEELVSFYLRRKVEGKALNVEIIKQIDIYKYEPWDLPKATHFGGEKEWYFFCLRGRKYRNSIRPNRVTGSGFWKATGIDRPIYSSSSENGGAGDCIGLKKSLVYYQGSAGRGTKTDWMMHEFRLPLPTDGTNAPPNIQGAEIWTICRIFQREISYNKKGSSQQDHAKGPLSSNRRSQYQRFEHYQCHYSTCSTSITNSFESDARDERASDSHRPFVLTGFNDVVVPTAAVPETSTVAAWSELGFRDGYSWDELGRIVELMNDPSNHV